MDPTLGEPFPAGPDTHVIPTYWPVPNAGVIPMNAFVVRAAEPVLVDTGTGALTDPFLDALASIVDPARLRWIWLTHEDLDHTGSLRRLLELAPRATVLTTFMAIGRMAPAGPFPMDRVRLVNPGNNGGPLLNRAGQVVGVVTALANPARQNFFVGIGFAVPIATAAGGAGGPQQ